MKFKQLFIPVLVLLSIFTVSCKKPTLENPNDKPNVDTPSGDVVENVEYEYDDKYYLNNKVGYTMKLLGNVDRNITTKFEDEGLPKYPIYGTNLGFTNEEKDELIKENDYLRASDNTYDKMDVHGNLYLNGNKIDRKLYRHSASENNYLGEVDVNEKAVVKQITIYPDKLGSYVTGLYAAPGEIIKIEVTNDDLDYLKNLNDKYNITDSSGKRFPQAKVIIGQKQERETKENNIWPAKDFVRMPLLANTMNVGETTTYAGSFLGGPVYIDLGDKVSIKEEDRRPVTFKISGAVEYHHYIYGLTTPSDFNRTKKSSAPFFELAVTDNLVRFSGARKYATNVDGSELSYDDAFECAKLWTKIAKTSHSIPVNSTTNASISFLFEPFVAAGAAVAFPGRSWVNAPLSWFSGALDADNFRNNGAWGDIHEFNHHHQNYGTGTQNDRLEVSNNATSLLSYTLHTNISAKRQKNNANAMGDYWNNFMNPEYALKDTISRTNSGTNYSLSGYADLLHAFGVENFINIANTQYSYNLPELTNNDERWYYASTLATGYDMTYYMNDILKLKLGDNIKNIVKNMNLRMYIPSSIIYQTGYGYIKEQDTLYSNTTLPYELKNKELLINLKEDLVLPSGFEIISSSLTKPTNGEVVKIDENNFKYIHNNSGKSGELYLKVIVKNSTLNLEDVLKFKLEFNYKNANIKSIDYEYKSEDYNPNTPSNFLDEEFKNGFTKAINKTESTDFDARNDNVNKHHIMVSNGKIYIPKTATYRFGLYTDKASYLYISKDNKNYELKAYADTWTLGSFDSSGTKGFDITLNKGDYLYYKLVTGMPHMNGGYGEIGWGIKTGPNNPRVRRIDPNYVMGLDDVYNPYNYRKVPLDNITEAYSKYIDNNNLTGFNIVDDSCYLDDKNTFGINNIFDNNQSTRYHSKHHVSNDKPIEFSVDLGSIKTFNTIEFTSFNNVLEAPSDFDLYIGDSKDNINTLVKEFRNLSITNGEFEAKLDTKISTQFIRIVVKRTTSNKFFICADILFKNKDTLHYIHHNSPYIMYQKNTYKYNYDVLGTFGYTHDITNGSFKFNFKGTGFIINSGVVNQGTKLEITIDGGNKILVEADKLDTFIIDNLTNTNHEVKVKVIGKYNLNAIKCFK